MYFAGIDIGSQTAETVVVNDKREIIATGIYPSGTNHEEAIKKSFSKTIEKAGIKRDEIDFIVSTGYGRLNVPFADKQVTEIACHGKGAHYFFPETRTIIDIGGQDNKVIKLNKKGKVIDFVMNDKCAAGTGRFLEVMAHALEVEVKELSGLSALSEKRIDITSTCGIFAESEVVSKIAQGEKKEDIINGIHRSISDRLAGMVNRMGLTSEVTMTGGGAKNNGVVKAIEEKLESSINIPEEPQIIGALGAALIGMEMSHEEE